VRGIEALRVVDASILPDIPSVATNVTTIMWLSACVAKTVGAEQARIAGKDTAFNPKGQVISETSSPGRAPRRAFQRRLGFAPDRPVDDQSRPRTPSI